jgi:glycosyltransferase involved in cell wall biosynthesis
MKLAVLYSRLSGYVSACLKAFCEQTGAELLIIAWPAASSAPFAESGFASLGEILDRSRLRRRQMEDLLRKFGPEAILVSGWIDPGYNRICGRFKAAGVPIIAGCDTQWKGSARQRLAALVAPWYVHRFTDVLWVSGERQRQLGQELGFRGSCCWDGFYACDWDRFAWKRPEALSPRRPSFLFVGRYVEQKGIRDLSRAYSIYRASVQDAWPLICAGKGDLASFLAEAGAEDRGFVQPQHLPDLMHEVAAFVLPSLFEPWGVVVQEAAASQLPLIVSQACGAGVHMVRDGYNGFVTEPGDPTHLASALIRMHKLSEFERHEFGKRSLDLSKQYTPERWARTLAEGLAMLRQHRGPCPGVK